MSKARSVKRHAGGKPFPAAQRTVLEASAPTGAPVTATDGHDFEAGDWLHTLAALDPGVTRVKIRPWLYFAAADGWWPANVLDFDDHEGLKRCSGLTEIRGADRVAFQLVSLTGAGLVRVWAATSFDGHTGF